MADLAGSAQSFADTDDDKIVIKWDCAESEDVLCESSPLWSHVDPL